MHDQSGTGATLFIEPMAVVNLNNDMKRYMAEEKEEMISPKVKKVKKKAGPSEVAMNSPKPIKGQKERRAISR